MMRTIRNEFPVIMIRFERINQGVFFILCYRLNWSLASSEWKTSKSVSVADEIFNALIPELCTCIRKYLFSIDWFYEQVVAKLLRVRVRVRVGVMVTVKVKYKVKVRVKV